MCLPLPPTADTSLWILISYLALQACLPCTTWPSRRPGWQDHALFAVLHAFFSTPTTVDKDSPPLADYRVPPIVLAIVQHRGYFHRLERSPPKLALSLNRQRLRMPEATALLRRGCPDQGAGYLDCG